MKKLGSDLVAQRSRYHYFEVFLEIYRIGILQRKRGSIEALKFDFHNLYHGEKYEKSKISDFDKKSEKTQNYA